MIVRWRAASRTDGVITGQPEIVVAETGALLLDLDGTRLRARLWWLDGGRFEIDLTRVPDRKELRVLVDPWRSTFHKMELIDHGQWEPEAQRLSGLTTFITRQLGGDRTSSPPDGSGAIEELSPDGRTRLVLNPVSGRMSHEIWVPSLFDAATGDVIFAAPDDGFDGSIVWLEKGRLRLILRHYWRPGQARVLIDRAAGTFRIEGRSEAEEPLATIAARIEEEFDRMADAAYRSAPPRPAIGPSSQGLLLRWITIFGGVAAFFAVLGIVALVQR